MRPSYSEANPHEILTQAKEGRQVEIPTRFSSQGAVSDFVFGALKYNFTSLDMISGKGLNSIM
jgi:hypothetical protein